MLRARSPNLAPLCSRVCNSNPIANEIIKIPPIKGCVVLKIGDYSIVNRRCTIYSSGVCPQNRSVGTSLPSPTLRARSPNLAPLCSRVCNSNPIANEIIKIPPFMGGIFIIGRRLRIRTADPLGVNEML